MSSAGEKTSSANSFSGRHRQRVTTRRVHLTNRVAQFLITLGGIATIVAVSTVGIFLVWVVIPLFLPPALTIAEDLELPTRAADTRMEHLALNEYLTMGWMLSDDGVLRAFRIDTGEPLAETRPFEDRTVTATAFGVRDGLVAFGFADGSMQYGTFGFATEFIGPGELDDDLRGLSLGNSAPYREGMLERTPEDQFRLQKLEVQLQDPVVLEEGAPIELIDVSMRGRGPVVVALSATDTLHIKEVTTRRNLITNEVTQRVDGGEVTLNPSDDGERPAWLHLAGLGDNAYVIWENGELRRFDTRNPSEVHLIEIVDTAPGDARLTATNFQIGKTSLVTGDNEGRLRVWFRIKPEDAETADGARLVVGHELPVSDVAVTALTSSARTRLLTAGYADGTSRMFHVTSERLLADITPPQDRGPVTSLSLAPKDDALLVFNRDTMTLWNVDAPHPETTVGAVITPVWYEGFNEPEHVWQSSSGTDDFEPKYGLYPLVFGTIKATFYSMLFGVPLAILAAIYSSEMMNPRLRSTVKPAVEMMASLPSVVLGFLAALVVAPFAEDIVPEILTAFFTVPFAILLGAYVWQLVPRPVALPLQRYRLIFMAAMLAAGVWFAFLLGRSVESLLFAGDVKLWLDGQIGSGTGAWMFILLPLSMVVSGYAASRYLSPLLRRMAANWSEFQVALGDLAKFLITAGATLVIAYAVSWFLNNGLFGIGGIDPRGSFVDTYVQRNALIVGFIMGFAIIPIIYTISEDALSAVPDHLRSASLGAGATPWQTAVRIILPTAASGLFSAVMIGFGRAVGETMIVLMAAGNTPVMDWNIFNGFRTLSANIAVELPEAVKDSTHYRMLFLAALTLFAMTFVLNTLAETIRQRFRKRAFQI